MPKVFLVGDPRNKTIGYLSSESYYPTIVDNVIWPTVLHYVIAKSYNITTDIREFTTHKIKRIARKSTKIHPKSPFYNAATLQKFQQNPTLARLLSETYPNQIKSANKCEEKALNCVRDQLINKKSNLDFVFPLLSKKDNEFLSGVIGLTKRMAIDEGCRKLFYEMVVDCLILFLGKNVEKKLNELKQQQSHAKLPNRDAISKKVMEMVIQSNFVEKHQIKTTKLLVLALKYFKSLQKSQKKSIHSKLINFDRLEYELPKVHRKYRGCKSNPIKKQPDSYGNNELMMFIRENSIVVEGDKFRRFSTDLVDLGGCFPKSKGIVNPTTIVFPKEKIEDVKKFIDTHTKSKKTYRKSTIKTIKEPTESIKESTQEPTQEPIEKSPKETTEPIKELPKEPPKEVLIAQNQTESKETKESKEIKEQFQPQEIPTPTSQTTQTPTEYPDGLMKQTHQEFVSSIHPNDPPSNSPESIEIPTNENEK